MNTFTGIKGQIGETQYYTVQMTATELVKTSKVAEETDNWLLLEAPDVYLYGALLHSAPYLADDQRVAVWAQLYGAAVQRLNEVSEDARFSGSGLTLKVRGLI